MSEENLLLEIARCPNVEYCLSSKDSAHPCYEIVRSQGVDSRACFQCPEPWNGQISSAPILFVSSNPSISEIEEHPTISSSDDEITTYFPFRFGGGDKVWIKEGRYTLLNDGSYSGAVRFLSAIRQRSAELLGRAAADVIPGVDYALTEIVRCKSRSEIGVMAARAECSQRYLTRTLRESGAVVIVSLGGFAASAIRDVLEVESDERLVGPIDAFGRIRHIAFMPHPNFWGPTTFGNVMPEALESLRTILRS